MINARKCFKLIQIYVYRQSCFVHSSVNFSNWNMTFKETVATTWKINEIQFCQLFLNPWHLLSSIWVLLGLWLVIYTVKIQFSFIFPASAWSPFLSVNLTDKLARLHISGTLCITRNIFHYDNYSPTKLSRNIKIAPESLWEDVHIDRLDPVVPGIRPHMWQLRI